MIFPDCGRRMMDTHILLEGLDDDRQLLDLPLVLSNDHKLEQALVQHNGHWAITSQRLSQTRGFTFSGEVDGYVAQMLADCDGTRPFGQLVTQLTDRMVDKMDKVEPACLAVAKNLLRSGLLDSQKP